MSLLRKSLGNISWLFANQVYRSVILFLRIAVLTAFLTREEFGLIAIANLFIGFVGLFQDMGFSVGILHKQKITKKEYSTLYWFNLGVGALLTIVLCGLAFPISHYYNAPVLVSVIVLLSLNVLFSSIGNQHRTVLQKQHKHRFMVVVDLIGLTFNFILSWFLAYKGYGIFAIVYSMLFYSFFSNIIFAYWGVVVKKKITFYYDSSLLKPFFNIGLYQMGSRFLDYFVRQIDILFISSHFSKSDLGLYSLCKNFVIMIYGFTAPMINLVLTPILSEIQNETKLINKKIYELLAVSSFLIMPLFFIPSFFSWEILYYVYGESYTDGALILSSLLIAYSLLPNTSIVASLTLAKGKTDLSFKWTVFNSLITLTFYLIVKNFSLEIITLNMSTLFILSTYIYYLVVVRKITSFKYFKFVKFQGIFFGLFILLFSYPYYYLHTNKPNLLQSIIMFIPIFCIYFLIGYKAVKHIDLLKNMQLIFFKKSLK
ncbi:oligosaccharide flippase family protein [Flavobacteriaceae bacterium]|nr:oligosaccharide flippase family protein [Flavobacteriaceae bacterium]